jgi:hypothetical protein
MKKSIQDLVHATIPEEIFTKTPSSTRHSNL